MRRVACLDVLVTRRDDLYFPADWTVNIEPTTEDLAEIALCAGQTARRCNVIPRVALLSFSNLVALRTLSATRSAVPFNSCRESTPRSNRSLGEWHARHGNDSGHLEELLVFRLADRRNNQPYIL